MGVINMAHGEMVMLGAYTTYVVQQVFVESGAGRARLRRCSSPCPAAFLVAGAVGVAIERGIIRFLYGRPLETLLATWGMSLILQQAVRSHLRAVEPRGRHAVLDERHAGGHRRPGADLEPHRHRRCSPWRCSRPCSWRSSRTAFGLQMRAVTQNRRMAGSMGIRTPWVDAMTFGLGSGIAGIAGVALAQIDNVSPNLGQSLHHRQLHGRGVRRRRQSLGHADRCHDARASSTSSSSPWPGRCSPRSSSSSR